MGSMDRANDDRTFKVDFSTEGVAKLRERVREKLKEFMGDYTDDTLVEYVIVLLRNGRRKEEAKNELNVFLGDDSESFVAWLWDHLAERLGEYLHPKDSHVDDTTKTRSLVSDQNESKESAYMESESEKKQSNKISEVQRTRQWRSQPTNAAETPPILSSEVHKIHYEEKKERKVRHDESPCSRSHRKRHRNDDQQHEQREARHNVSGRLLQFAVRDALTSNSSNSLKEPLLKRLCSVVSTSTHESSTPEAPRRIQSVARVVNPMATVIKAVAEAAEDVQKIKPSRSVFDRISHSTVETLEMDQRVGLTEAAGEVEEYKDFKEDEEQTQPQYLGRHDYHGTCDENMLMSETGTEPNSVSGYCRLNLDADVSYASISGGNKVDNLMNVKRNVAIQADNVKRVKRNNYQNHFIEAPLRPKLASSFGNMNPGKTPKFQEQRETADVGPKKFLQEHKVIANEVIMQSSKENTSTVAVYSGNVKHVSNIQKAPKTQISGPGSFSAIRPSEDAVSRTIFITNVHFGATKDSLSRHFNKFGEVLKVAIVTDPATGQPTGSAYIEFIRKEAADNALSLNGTSFMSRILKIMKGSAAQQEVAPPAMTWSRAGRGSPYSGARLARAPFARGVTGAFRGRPPIRPGARSLQWKRESPAAAASAEAGTFVAGNTGLASGGTRSLTFIRTGTN